MVTAEPVTVVTPPAARPRRTLRREAVNPAQPASWQSASTVAAAVAARGERVGILSMVGGPVLLGVSEV